MVYISGGGLPGVSDIVYADWTQERIEPTVMETVPEAVGVNHAQMAPLLTDYYLEMFELVT